MSLTLVPRGGCPLCASQAHRVHMDFAEIPVFRCHDCSFIYSSKIMPPETLSSYYAESFGGKRQMQGQVVNARVNSALFKRLLKGESIGKNTLLDIGTGYGFFLDAIRRNHGMQVSGVELSIEEAEFGRKQLHLDIRDVALAQAGLESASYDIVTAFEVIEHIEDPSAFVAELASYLKPGGILIIATDNFESPVVRSLGKSFPKWIPHTHVSHFSPVTLARVIEKNGLRIARKMSFTPWEFEARKLAGMIRGSKRGGTYSLSEALKTEGSGDYRFFKIRRAFNDFWARLTLRNDAEGAMMYLMARKLPNQPS